MIHFSDFSLLALKRELSSSTDDDLSFLRFFQRLTFVLSLGYLTIFGLLGSWIGFGAVTLFFTTLLLSFGWVAKGQINRASNWLALLFSTVPPICIFFSGGIHSPYIAWLVTPIFASAALVGPRIGMLASCGMAIVYIAMLAAQPIVAAVNELIPGYQEPLNVISTISAIFFLAIFAWKRVSDYRDTLNQMRRLIDNQERIYATIGHELRTPAATMDMMLTEVQQQNANSAELSELKRLSHHLLAIIDDMKLATNANHLAESLNQKNEVRVYSTLERSVQGLYDLAERQGVTLSLEGVKATSNGHFGSAKAIRQIVQNLVKNAILHSGGSQVSVTLSYTHLTDEYTQFLISVSDNGRGIDPADIGRLYDPFVRGNSVADGSGLGLHICKTLAQGMPQGALNYHRSDAGGACFELSFTLKKLGKSVDTEKEASHSIIAGKKILLVEDTDSLRMLGKVLLERAGAQVCIAEDGKQALEALKSFDADLVLTDIMMPNMNGYQLTSALRQQGYDKPIIGVTGATVGNEASLLIEAGANRVLAKPLTKNGLEQALRDAEQLGEF